MIYDLPTLISCQNRYKKRIDWIFQSLILDKMTFEERKKVEEVHLSYPLFSQGQIAFPMLLHSYPEKNEIVLPVLTLKLLDDLAVASVWLDYHGYNQETITDYLALMKYGSNQFRMAPFEALKIPEKAWHLDPKMDGAAQKIFNSAITWLIGHELGHLSMDHQPDPEGITSYNSSQEITADEFAVGILKRAQVFPSGLKLVFYMLGLIRKQQVDFSGEKEWDRYLNDTSVHPITSHQLDQVIDLLGENSTYLLHSEQNLKIARNHLNQIVQDLAKLKDLLNSPQQRFYLKLRALTANKTSLYPRYNNQLFSSELIKAFSNPNQHPEGIYQGQLYELDRNCSFEILIHWRQEGNTCTGNFLTQNILGEFSGNKSDNNFKLDWARQNQEGKAVLTISENGNLEGYWNRSIPAEIRHKLQANKLKDLKESIPEYLKSSYLP